MGFFMKYRVSHAGQEVGPLALEEIISKVRTRELELFDYIFEPAQNDWVLMMEHPALAAKLRGQKPPRPPGATTETVQTTPAPATIVTTAAPQVGIGTTTPAASTGGEWFVLKGEHKFGPFALVEIVRMLQQKVVFPFDFVWHAGLNDWQRLAEVADFKSEKIKALFEKAGKKGGEIFVPRKHKRKKFASRVIIHDNLTLWKGESFEISKGGVGVSMRNALVVPGQQVIVHFSGHEELPPFNAVCEVVSKKFVSDDSPVEYGLRFLSMSPESQEEFNKKVT
jgi:hypothetical protein